ncbi:MAG: TolC family protein [Pirellulaceae bacterium]|nr:TolC family protein [Pirellulaceae bacterium]
MRDSHFIVVLKPTQLLCVLVLVITTWGCSRSKYRVAADREAYSVIAERNRNPQWRVANYKIDPDPRSRYFDPYDPDCPPMPNDDPASNRYMRMVDGKKGWEHWSDNGVRQSLENPAWRELMAEYAEIDEEGAVKLDLNSALKIAYIHSPDHQRQLETLYLTALDVTTERFRLDTQFFGGYDIAYQHRGSLVPASLGFDGATGTYVISPPFDAAESNRLTLGLPTAGEPVLQASRRTATAGQLVAGFANSFVFEFTGPDAGLSASLLNFTFLQPLLRGAGRDIALEQLTLFERRLLANLRSYGQFRQGFYTQISIGELGISGPQRQGASTNLQVFSGQAGLGGYVGLLQQLQQIRNAEDNLNLQVRTLAQLEALLDAGLIDLVQVDQFRQNVERDRASLLQSRNDFLRTLDGYKTSTLGLPPDLRLKLDDQLIRKFQFVDRTATGIQDAIAILQEAIGELPNDADQAAIKALQSEMFGLLEPLENLLASVQEDLSVTKQSIPQRARTMTEAELGALDQELALLDNGLNDLEDQYRQLDQSVDELRQASARRIETAKNTPEQPADDVEESDIIVEDAVSELNPDIRDTVLLLRRMLRFVQGAVLVQARARLEAVNVDAIELESEDAFQLALANRLDFMNARAALVDSWRRIQVEADALQSVLNVTASGELQTAENNPLSFRAPTSSMRMGVEFDAPFTRLVERNAYRGALINYQQSRRGLIQSRDSLHLGLRVLLRQIEQLRTNLEIQRRAVAIAIRRVDLTRSALYAPVPPPQPGQRAAPFGPTAAINLLSAQAALRDTQDSFLGVWLNYYAAKLRLARELGLMSLDVDGRWIEMPFPTTQAAEIDVEPLPPPVDNRLLDAVESLPENFRFQAPENNDVTAEQLPTPTAKIATQTSTAPLHDGTVPGASDRITTSRSPDSITSAKNLIGPAAQGMIE